MHGNLAQRLRTATVAATAITLGGCFFDTTINYQRDTESYIADTVSVTLGESFSQVVCERPIDTNIGTRFECTALDATDSTWVFDTEITGENQFEVTVFSRP